MESIVEKYAYKTKSLDEFAVALALGAEVERVERREDDKFLTFHLKSSFDMEKMTLEIASRTLLINAYDLCEAMRRAKSLIHSR